MNDTIGAPAPAWLRVVAALGLAWNLFGCYAYLQMTGTLPGADASMTTAGMPTWVVACFAVSVFGGALGCLGLLLLRGWSVLLLLLSLLCLLVQDVWAFGLGGETAGKSPILPIAVNLIAILLAWLAYSARKKGWLS